MRANPPEQVAGRGIGSRASAHPPPEATASPASQARLGNLTDDGLCPANRGS